MSTWARRSASTTASSPSPTSSCMPNRSSVRPMCSSATSATSCTVMSSSIEGPPRCPGPRRRCAPSAPASAPAAAPPAPRWRGRHRRAPPPRRRRPRRRARWPWDVTGVVVPGHRRRAGSATATSLRAPPGVAGTSHRRRQWLRLHAAGADRADVRAGAVRQHPHPRNLLAPLRDQRHRVRQWRVRGEVLDRWSGQVLRQPHLAVCGEGREAVVSGQRFMSQDHVAERGDGRQVRAVGDELGQPAPAQLQCGLRALAVAGRVEVHRGPGPGRA